MTTSILHDIPFHKINESFPVDIVNDVTEETRKKVLDEGFNTHTKLYGAYGIAFSKKWCYENGFQPVLYVNEKSEYLMQLKKLYAHIDIVNITLHLLLVHPVTCFIMQPLPLNHSIAFS